MCVGARAVDFNEPAGAASPRMRAPNCLGDTIVSRGNVVKKYTNGDEKLLDVEVHLDNQLAPDATIAFMTLQLP